MPLVTGVKPSGLDDPVVAVDNTAWLVIETSDGKVVKIHPSSLFGLTTKELDIYQLNFTGSSIAIPLGTNAGKLPADDAKVQVFSNGVEDYLTTDYTLTRNAGATPDEVVFVNARAGMDIHIKLTL